MTASSTNSMTAPADPRREIIEAVGAAEERISRVVGLLVDVQPELARLPCTEGTWSVRDTLCHLAGYYPAEEIGEQLRRLRALPERTTAPRGAAFDIDTANERIRSSFDGCDIPQIAGVILGGRAALRTAIGELEPGLLERVAPRTPWGRDVALSRVVLESTAWHDRGHLDEIDAAVLAAEPVLYYQYLAS